MSEPEDIIGEYGADNRPPDPMQRPARERVEKFIDEHPEQVFFSRQIEILHEGDFFSLGDKPRNPGRGGQRENFVRMEAVKNRRFNKITLAQVISVLQARRGGTGEAGGGIRRSKHRQRAGVAR